MMQRPDPCPLVHVELMTPNLARACVFLHGMFRWEVDRVRTVAGTYVTLELHHPALEGGVVESDRRSPAWLPYVEVESIREATERALTQGATLVMGPREGPVGWRSVIATPECGELALWQPKR